MLGEIIRIISGCVLIIVCTAAVATISWHALVLMAVTLPASAYATRRFGGQAGRQARELRSRYGVVGSWIYEIVTELPRSGCSAPRTPSIGVSSATGCTPATASTGPEDAPPTTVRDASPGQPGCEPEHARPARGDEEP